ncbi:MULTISPECIES: MFS transporter [Clostridia]|uniref:MFS transporter n=1 Tax=Clostridia TaxID=186801 RepID=UPI00067E995F|nr:MULTISPECIES: MFS transporter [Clostridia]
MKKTAGTKKINPNKVPISKLFAWPTRNISAGAVVIIIGYLSLYCTDTLGMSPALVGSLLMASKIFDGVTDLIAGYLVDNTKTKWGKGRPYEFCIIGLWICTYALFAVPEQWGVTGKAIWIFIMYTLTFSVFQTLLNASETTYIIRAFGSKEAVTKVSSIGGIIITLGCMVVSVTFPMMVASQGGSASGWRSFMMIYTIPLLALGLIRFFIVKEDKEVETEDIQSSTGEDKVSVKEIFILLRKNKYLWLCGIALMIPKMLGAMSAGTYYFQRVVGNLGAYSILQIFSVVILVVMVFFPMLIRRFSGMYVIGMAAVIGIVGYVLNFFAGKNMALLILGSVLCGISTLPGSYLKSPIIMSIAEYNTMHGMKRMEATMASVLNFLEKLGNAFALFMMGILLSAASYDGTAAVQPDSAILMIRLCYSLIPAAMTVIVIFCCIAFNPLDKEVAKKNLNHEEKENGNI